MEKEDSTELRLEIKGPLVTDKATYISVHDFRLTKQDTEKAYTELNETEEKKLRYLNELKKKLEGEQEKKYRMDDEYLLRYLRFGKFNLDKVNKIIQNFYSLRKKHPQIFTIPSNLEMLLNYGIVNYLPYTTENGNVLMWMNYKKWKTEEISVTQLIQVGHLILDIITMNPKCQIHGCICIWDFRGITMEHAKQILYPSTAWILSKFLQDVYPYRIKCVIGLYTNSVIRSTFNAVRPLLKKKIADRVLLLGSDLTELHNHINPVLLPKEYGGTLEESKYVSSEDILQNLHYLRYENSFV